MGGAVFPGVAPTLEIIAGANVTVNGGASGNLTGNVTIAAPGAGAGHISVACPSFVDVNVTQMQFSGTGATYTSIAPGTVGIDIPLGTPETRLINTGGLLTGGGDLTADRTITFALEDLQDNVAAMCVAGGNMTITYNDPAGTLTFSAALGATGTPTLRASSFGVFNAGNIHVPFPAGTAAGDIVFAFATSGFAFTSVTQAGWTILNATFPADFSNGVTIAKVVNAGDIATGYVDIVFGGAFNGNYGAVTVVGGTMGGIRQIFANHSVGNPSIASEYLALAEGQNNDAIIGFTYCRGAANVSISNFTQYGTNNGANASGYLGFYSAGAIGVLGFNEIATYSAANSGVYFSVIALKGV